MPLSTHAILVKGYDYRTIAFSHLLQNDIHRKFVFFNNTEKADSLLTFNLGGVQVSQSSSLRFIAATNPAYLDGQPSYKKKHFHLLFSHSLSH
jgi:hypothetical protein